jgi:Domain of unknown function (DUF4328)
MASSPANGYRSASALAFCATLLFVALIVTEALAAISLAGQIQLLDAARFGVSLPPAQAEAQDARQRLFGALELALGLAAGIALWVWLYRANRNARALGAEGMTYSPAWSVGWFFVPLANLVMPYVVFRELWKASTPGAGPRWRQAPVSVVLGLWYAVCLARAVIQYSPWPVVTGHWRLAQIRTFGRLWLDGLWEFSWGLLIGQVVEIAASVLTVVVVVSITDLQERRRVLLVGLQERELAAIG